MRTTAASHDRRRDVSAETSTAPSSSCVTGYRETATTPPPLTLQPPKRLAGADPRLGGFLALARSAHPDTPCSALGCGHGRDAFDAQPVQRIDTRLTVDDFLLFPDDGKRHEIIDGVHDADASPVTRHQAIPGRLRLSLGTSSRRIRNAGAVSFAPFDRDSSRAGTWWRPDLAVIAGDPARHPHRQERARRRRPSSSRSFRRTRKVDESIKRRLFDSRRRAGVSRCRSTPPACTVRTPWCPRSTARDAEDGRTVSHAR